VFFLFLSIEDLGSWVCAWFIGFTYSKKALVATGVAFSSALMAAPVAVPTDIANSYQTST